ncbi:hypothetical protein Clacol_003822 [Clathrus columnatus]|uniref:COP9 signalosome complex subunit 6 n=1 Tax=Clathrus columnatus TaxID=1419009 RepID=A0AAV5A4P8_9AGAM|nr:hypothetical protein Clacol_003822 [Clathrus columnatus]
MSENSVVLPSSTTSTLSLSLHPLPILNISEHLTRKKLQTGTNNPLGSTAFSNDYGMISDINCNETVIGALLGTQNGREVEIVNSFDLAVEETTEIPIVDDAFLVSRTQQYKQVFPSLELIGWYTVAPEPTILHIALHEQLSNFTATPILLLLQPPTKDTRESPALPFKAYEPTIEIKDRKSRSVFVEASYVIETGEAERIAVDWTARGGEGGSTLLSNLQTQRAAIKMLYDRIQILVSYVASVIAGKANVDHTALRSLSALLSSLPASDAPEFREEFDTEHADVQITAYLASLTKSTNILNDLVDKHVLMTSAPRDPLGHMSGRRTRARQMFGVLQHRTFPIFFMLSEVLSGILLLLWTLGHPEVASNWTNPLQEDVAQAWSLATVLLTQGTNDWIIGPLTSKTMFERHKLEKSEGKNYNDVGVSDEMKALNKRFGMLHGISYLLSLTAVIALTFHGLWLGNIGVKPY